jgi:hypothetical protein
MEISIHKQNVLCSNSPSINTLQPSPFKTVFRELHCAIDIITYFDHVYFQDPSHLPHPH